jgi:hypothetical protein
MDQVEIPLGIARDVNKAQIGLRLRMSESHSELQISLKNRLTGRELLMSALDEIPILFESTESLINRYSLVFKRNSSSTEDFPKEREAAAQTPNMHMTVYPNPGNDYVYIRISNNTQVLPYAVYASDGRLVKSGSIKDFETLDIKSLSKGFYYLNCNGNSAKIIKS